MGFNARLEGIQSGATVCVIGRGTANMVHAHYRVVRVTKTMIVVGREVHGRRVERRYRFDGSEVGASEYGGTVLDRDCQRSAKKA